MRRFPDRPGVAWVLFVGQGWRVHHITAFQAAVHHHTWREGAYLDLCLPGRGKETWLV